MDSTKFHPLYDQFIHLYDDDVDDDDDDDDDEKDNDALFVSSKSFFNFSKTLHTFCS